MRIGTHCPLWPGLLRPCIPIKETDDPRVWPPQGSAKWVDALPSMVFLRIESVPDRKPNSKCSGTLLISTSTSSLPDLPELLACPLPHPPPPMIPTHPQALPAHALYSTPLWGPRCSRLGCDHGSPMFFRQITIRTVQRSTKLNHNYPINKTD